METTWPTRWPRCSPGPPRAEAKAGARRPDAERGTHRRAGRRQPAYEEGRPCGMVTSPAYGAAQERLKAALIGLQRPSRGCPARTLPTASPTPPSPTPVPSDVPVPSDAVPSAPGCGGAGRGRASDRLTPEGHGPSRDTGRLLGGVGPHDLMSHGGPDPLRHHRYRRAPSR